jgi:two-component system KDP operon response regulator KdpE
LSLLTCLVRRQGQTLSHEYLLYHAWGLSAGAHGKNYVKTYIRYLRVKIEPDPKNPVYIITDHGAGYRLALPANDAQR